MIQNFIAKLSPKEKKIFYIAVIFILLALVDRIFLGPTLSKMKTLEEDIEQEKNIIKRDLHFLSYTDRILKENEDLSEFYSKEAKSEEEIIASFLKIIEMLATEAKINLIKVNPSETKPKKGYVEYYAQLECDGKLENLITFMHAIDSSKELLKIVKMSLAPKRASAEEVTAAMTVVKMIIDSSSMESAKRINEEAPSEESGPSNAEGDDIKPSVWERMMADKTGKKEEAVEEVEEEE